MKNTLIQYILPIYCVLTRKVDPEWIKAISIDNKDTKFDMSLLKYESIEEAWRIIGEQSEWLINLLYAFKDNVNTPVSHTQGFLNHYANMTAFIIIRP